MLRAMVFRFVILALSLAACARASTETPVPSAVPFPSASLTFTPVLTRAPSATPTTAAIFTFTPTPVTIACGENPPAGAQPYLKNWGFEETVTDKDGTLDPSGWDVTEGEAIKGTDNVPPDKEQPALVQVVGAEGNIRPCDGDRMLKIDARLHLKSSVHQPYLQPISEGRLVQELAVYPLSEEYVQQIEVRGERDFKGIEGKEMFHLR